MHSCAVSEDFAIAYEKMAGGNFGSAQDVHSHGELGNVDVEGQKYNRKLTKQVSVPQRSSIVLTV
jgi:hypothetical protein